MAYIMVFKSVHIIWENLLDLKKVFLILVQFIRQQF